MLKGKIFDISKDLYYVKSDNIKYMAKARGNFRKKNLKPMVGDDVLFEISNDNIAYIVELLERKNKILRPPVANIDKAIIVISLKDPEISYRILDRYIMYYEIMKIPIVICINKCDLIDYKKALEIEKLYKNLGYEVILNSLKTDNKEKFKEICKDKISVITGPSGVGKSTILKFLNPLYSIDTSDISQKNKRGKHTTRKSTLYEIFENSFIIDTAGFTSLDIGIFVDEKEKIRNGFVEFSSTENCKFSNCMHINEPCCMVKKMIEDKKIEKSRYDSYLFYLDEYLKNRRY